MTTARSALIFHSHGVPFRRLLAVATAALITVGFTIAPASSASAAGTVTDATTLAAAFASGGDVTLDGDITVVAAEGLIVVAAGVPVALNLNGHALSVTGPIYAAGIGVPAGAVLTILDGPGGGGSLTATGGAFGAGIGGGIGGAGGDVEIAGGTVTATGGGDSAGIGGGSEGAGGNVKITGGTVTATGSVRGAGIGGGYDRAGGTVEITGGTVVATGSDNAAGIGGGYFGANGVVRIAGGTVTATAGANGAGIGGGYNGAGGVVGITGGTVAASGGRNAAGIGGGAYGAGGVVGISGGTVAAFGGAYAAGIGGGIARAGGSVDITGGTVTVNASPDTPTFVIGAGFQGIGFGSLSNSGTLTVAAGSTLIIPPGNTVPNSGTIRNEGTISVGGTVNNVGKIVNTGIVDPVANVTGNNFLLTFNNTQSTGSSTTDTLRVFASTLSAAEIALPAPVIPGNAFTGWFTAAIAGNEWDAAMEITGDLALYALWAVNNHTVGFDLQGHGAPISALTVVLGGKAVMPGLPVAEGFTFTGWFTDAGMTTSFDFNTVVTADMMLYAGWVKDAVVPPAVNLDPPATSPAADNTGATPSAAPGPGLATTGAAGLAGGIFAALALLLAGGMLVLTRMRTKRS